MRNPASAASPTFETNRSGELEVFVQVAEHGSFSAAARHLGVSPSATSKIVARMEARLGAQLLLRSTRRVQLTPEGRQLYERGQRPEPGSVLAFRSSGGMRLGHVAVVQRIVNGREIEIEHANWEGPGIRKGTVMRNVSVIDVSPRNDWTAVRVQIGRSDESFGRVYPTYGFIHNRPIGASPRINYARSQGFEEVAEAPASNRPLDITVRNTGR